MAKLCGACHEFFLYWIGKERNCRRRKKNIAKIFHEAILYEASLEDIGTVLDRMNISHIDENMSLVLFELKDNPCEFPCIIDFHIFPFKVPNMRTDIYLARYFSDILQCRTIADDTELGLGKSPYLSIYIR